MPSTPVRMTQIYKKSHKRNNYSQKAQSVPFKGTVGPKRLDWSQESMRLYIRIFQFFKLVIQDPVKILLKIVPDQMTQNTTGSQTGADLRSGRFLVRVSFSSNDEF